MSATLHFHGHATFSLVLASGTVVFDPFLTGNPAAVTNVNDLAADLICVTHAHDDHVADVAALAGHTDATVVANFEIANHFAQQGVENIVGINPGGTYDAGFCRVKWTPAFHSSSFADGSYGGEANGILLSSEGLRLYFAGDTALFSDMRLIGGGNLDVAVLPIGDHFTMGIDDSLQAIRFLEPRLAVPMHYNTFPPIEQDVAAWARRVAAETDAQPVVLQPGESATL
ncbi:MAG: metal-dependent hydrolase [Anaerolineaceae bacterium]|nr:metal-dependent hydrolase [Anaerolineaceae bacterium]